MSYRFPVYIELAERLCVIVGGGNVAVRKAEGLIAAGAEQVHVVAPVIHQDLPASVRRIVAKFEPSHLDGAGLVFAATNSAEVNNAVVREAKRRGILVNRADSAVEPSMAGDFTLPARLESGGVIVAVSAGGSPGLATIVRDVLKENLDPAYGKLASALMIIRPRVLACEALSVERRREVLRELVSAAALAAAEAGGVESVWKFAMTRFPELAQTT